LLKKPVYAVLGASGPRRVPVYDGSIYFADLLPQYVARWQDRFKEEIDAGLQAGHRAFKIKIGRGHKWMERAAGDARDVEVVEVIRRHGGNDVVLGVDASNGYDLEGTKRFLGQTGRLRLAWIEEPFPEKVEQCLELKRFMAGKSWKTLLADGETQRDLDAFRPFVQAKAIDVLQADMNAFGVEGILAESDLALPQGIRIAPHNWGSLVGFYLQLHVSRAVTNFYRAEHDPLSSNVLVAADYKIEDGLCAVPDAPGFGLAINEKTLNQATINVDLKA
jgi:L-alanine-DL-glutamate epimerase-like enolase superfamily enzyme